MKVIKLNTLLRYGIASTLFFSTMVFAKDEHGHGQSSTGWDVYAELQKGNQRFSEGDPDHPRQNVSRRDKLTQGQNPPAIVLTCSDSRVPPEIIFDQGLGDIFSVRSIGHVASSEAIASIEFAAENLGSKLLVVMGHESCGAVRAALTTPTGKSTGSPFLDRIISNVKPNIDLPNLKITPSDPHFRLAVKDHVSATTRDLVRRSAKIRDLVKKEKLILAEAIYNLKSGKVEFWAVGNRFSYEKGHEHHALGGNRGSRGGKKVLETPKRVPAGGHHSEGPKKTTQTMKKYHYGPNLVRIPFDLMNRHDDKVDQHLINKANDQ